MTIARVLGLGMLLGAVAACDGQPSRADVAPGGDAARGREAIARYGCGACHQIPGVTGARGIVGPSLRGVAARPYLAGHLPNGPANLEAWIRRPREVDPKTIMPDLAVTERDARDIATFLLTQPP
jgi:cytochrome c